jgi:hypothetical protein
MPSPTTKTRQALKARFVRGAMPTEADFSDLIDACLCKTDDGVIKLPNEPLSLVRQQPDQPLLRFFEDPAAAGSAWQIHLSAEGKPGFAVANQEGKPTLFLDKATGHVGIGTTTPGARLTVENNTNGVERSKDPQSSLTYGGLLAIKSPQPQLDFIDVNGAIDWAIHVNEGHLYFIRSPWEISDFHLDGNTGNVGIGTAEPKQKLHVKGTAAIDTLKVNELFIADKKFVSDGLLGGKITTLENGNVGIGEPSPASRLVVCSAKTDQNWDFKDKKDPVSRLTMPGDLAIKGGFPQIDFIDTSTNPELDGADWAIQVNMGRMWFVRSPWNVEDFHLHSSGKVGIGTYEPQYKLHVAGAARADSWTTSSDLRLKQQDSIRPLSQSLSRVANLRPVEYRFIADEGRPLPLLGFIAQEVEDICPEVVDSGSDGMKSINTTCLIALLAQAIKELAEANEAQQAQLNRLEAQINPASSF